MGLYTLCCWLFCQAGRWKFVSIQWLIARVTDESRWGASGIICAEYSSSMSVTWTLWEEPSRCLCRMFRDKLSETILPRGQELTGAMWWEAMRSARYSVRLPSVCMVDCLSCTSGRSHCPTCQHLRKENDSQEDNASVFRASLCSHSSIVPLQWLPFVMRDSY